MSKHHSFLTLLMSLLASSIGMAQVTINEMASASNERMLKWSAAGVPTLGTGINWNAPAFTDTAWPSGNLPAGWGSTVSTNLQTAMLNKTPTAYFRKSFIVSATDAARTTPLVLQVEYDDGFVAYLNGVEIARKNAGPPNHFLYVGQPAYNPNNSAGLGELQLGAANTLLVTGTNLLAIEVHNYSISSNLRINAGLKVLTSTANITVTKASYDFNAANNATRTHTNTAGSVTNTASGVPPDAGWLATAADPVSDNTWTSLQVVTGEMVGLGVGGTGGLRYNFIQTGTNRAVAMRAPSINMANAWTPGAISPATMGTTTLSFRYRTTNDQQFAFRMDPALNQSANSLDGLSAVGAPYGGSADYDWSNTIANSPGSASGGQQTSTISATGSTSSSISGSINIGNYSMIWGFYSPTVATTCRSGSMRIAEDNTAGAGPGGTTGVFSWSFPTWPDTVDMMNARVKTLTVAGWSPPNITALDFEKTRLSFRWKLPLGRRIKMRLEPSSGPGVTNQMELGAFIGTGNWEAFSVSLSELPNNTAFRTKMNAAGGGSGSLVMYYDGVPFANGEAVLLDSLNLYYEQAGEAKDENVARNYSGAADASRSLSVDGAGVQTPATTGTPVTSYSLFADPAVRGFAATAVEDATVGGGNGGATGFLRCAVTDAADVGGPWGLVVPGIQVRNWTAGAITTPNLSDVMLQFAAKIPVGVTVSLFAEPVGGSTANRATFPVLTGNGTWQVYTREFATATNIENLRGALNTAVSNTLQLNFTGPNNAVIGEVISLDDIEIVPWRYYQTLLSAGTNQQRFLDYLNQNNLVSFIPTFSKTTSVTGSAASFFVDNFAVNYVGPDPNALVSLVAPGAASGAWKYFAGIAEPSGGLYDPALVTATVTIPPGEEDDYDNPQNFRDWIELRNTTGAPINLAGWRLSDELDTPAKWVFPVSGSTISANGYLIVMCDNRNEANGTGTYLHSNFSLSATGEAVRLYNSAGTLISAMTSVPDQDNWHTWAVNPANGTYGFSDLGTPGAANAGSFTTDRVKSVDFKTTAGANFPGGFYTGAQTVVLSTTTPGATIRYTLDGTDPTESTGTLYTAPLVLTAPNNKTGRVVRATAFLPGWLPSTPKVHTFLIDQHPNLRTLPAMNFSGNPGRAFYLPQGVMAINGGTYSSAWTANGPESYDIPINRGDPYERLISAEFYYPDGRDGWREEVGLRISSSPYSRPLLRLDQTSLSPWTSDHTQKPSFNLYWRDDYGNSKLKHATIADNDIREYKQLRLRAGKNDILNPFIIDELSRHLYRDMGWFTPIGTLSSLYVNGSFKGIYNPTERLREPMFQEHYHTDNQFDVRYIGDQVDGDVVAWNAMQTALNTLSANPTLANYNAVQNHLDPVNIADYFLVCIYMNADDWPGNNWAAQRERSPEGRYRMVAWDYEGAWGRFGKSVTNNTIESNLLNSGSECGDIFKRLWQSPEWRLLFADRIQKHMFNGGVLDDRGANSHVKKLKDDLVAQATPLVQFVSNPGTPSSVAIDLSWYNTLIGDQNAVDARRGYLFDAVTTQGSFRDTLLWPSTEPPSYSQFGGVTPANYPLVISKTAGAGSIIYYTLDGSDPRLAGGAVSPTALVYSGPVNLNAIATVRSRVLSNAVAGEWSPLTEAVFQPGAVTPTASRLSISEIMYHPPDPTSAETASLIIDAGDFEFIRLTNIYSAPLDLRQLQFTNGVTFNFATGDVQAIAPGGSVLVVKRKFAFEKRYGIGFSNMIAGEFAGSLDNSGERIKLANGPSLTTIQDFVYKTNATDPTWPIAADGYGPSMILTNLTSPITHGLGAAWTTSAQPGGIPGGVARTMNYATWKSLSFSGADFLNASISGPTADPDGDGLTNSQEYTFGSCGLVADSANFAPQAGVMTVSSQDYLTMDYRIVGGASEATVTPEVSTALANWLNGNANIVTVNPPVTLVDGSIAWKVRSAVPMSGAVRGFLRLSLVGP